MALELKLRNAVAHLSHIHHNMNITGIIFKFGLVFFKVDGCEYYVKLDDGKVVDGSLRLAPMASR